MSFCRAFICGMAVVIASPTFAQTTNPVETTEEMKQDSSKAQKEMPAVGKEATSSPDETTEEMKQESEKAQKEMPTVGKEATTDQKK